MDPLVPGLIVVENARGARAGSLQAATLFADISGFTALTEEMTATSGRDGAEAVAAALRYYFDPLVVAVHRRGGHISGFAGDAFTAVFPDSASAGPAHLALEAADEMVAFFAAHPVYRNRFGAYPFGLKIGLSYGEVTWGVVRGLSLPWSFFFRGAGIDGCAEAQWDAPAGEIRRDVRFAERLLQEESIRAAWTAPAVGVSEPGPAAEFRSTAVREFALEGEFRTVTCVFLGLATVVGIEDVMALVQERVHAFGGYLARFDFGDKGCNAAVFFGAPISRENDRERALAFLTELLARGDVSLRAGVTEAVGYVGFNGGRERHELTCLGPGTNLAARLMTAADWGACLVTARVARSRGFRFAARGVMSFKGVAVPLEVAALLGQSTVEAVSETADLVGREPVVEALLETLRPLVQGRPAGFVYLDGDAGLGKSAVLGRVGEALAEAGVRVLRTSCDRTLRALFNPFGTLLASAAGIARDGIEGAPRAAFDAYWRTFVDEIGAARPEQVAEVERIHSIVASVIGLAWPGSLHDRLEPKLRRENVEDALATWLVLGATGTPTLLIIDDGQEMDEGTAAVLARTERRALAVPIGILCAARPRDDGRTWRLSAHESEARPAVALRRLSRPDLSRLASQVLSAPVSDSLVGFLEERTSGNPFYARQVLGYLKDEQCLRDAPDGLAMSGCEERLPDDVKAVLVARIDRLEPRLRKLVQAASVLGRDVDVAVLAAMDAASDRDVFATKVAAVSAMGVWTPAGDGQVRFRSRLMRDAAYDMQTRGRQRVWHRAAAEAIERLHGGSADAQAVLSEQWRRAGEARRAAAALLPAARRAVALHDLTEAERLYAAFLEIEEDASEDTVAARRELGSDVLPNLPGGASRTTVVLERALEQANALGLADAAARVRAELGSHCMAIGRLDEAEQFQRAALAHFEATGALSRAASSLEALAVLLRLRGEPDGARARCEQALEYARRAGNRRGEGHLLITMGNSEGEYGRFEEARARYETALAISREVGDEALCSLAYGCLSNVFACQGMLLEAMETNGEAYEIVRRLGARPHEVHLLCQLGQQNHEAGDLEQARAYLERALAIERDLGYLSVSGFIQFNLGLVLCDLGDPPAAKRCFEDALRAYERMGDRRGVAVAREGLGVHADRTGHPARAVTLFEQALLVHRDIGNESGVAIVLSRMADAYRRLGDLDRAEGLLAEAEALLLAVGDKLEVARATCIRGLLRCHRGLAADAELEHARAAVARMHVGPRGPVGRLLAELERAVGDEA